MLGVAVALTAALAFPAPANPIETARAGAEARWGPLPCDVHIERRALPGWQVGEASYFTDGERTWNCVMTLDTEQVRGAIRCSVAKHEYGHFYGLDHSSNPRDVMHTPVTWIPKECRRGR